MFKALADPSRRQLLDRLNDRNGQTLRELCTGLSMARQSVSKHLAVLIRANLVSTIWHGREKLHYLNTEPINAIADRWINQFDRQRVRALADLKSALEATPMSNTDFVYTTYIRTTPERLWQALTDPEFTSRYWGVRFDSAWTAGAPMSWQYHGVSFADPHQTVLEYDPHRRLAYTWHSYTPEFAETVGFSPEYTAQAAAEPRSKVTFNLEPIGDKIKLTVIHDGFTPESVVLQDISNGWPEILSDLKTLLETETAVSASR